MTSPDNDSVAVMCPAHQNGVIKNQGLAEFPLDSFADHTHLIRSLYFENNALQSLPADFCDHFPSLSSLTFSHNQLQTFSPGIGKFALLEFLNLSFNRFASLPDDFADALKTLQILVLSGNPLFKLPDCVCSSSVLQELYASQTGIEDVPDVFPADSQLKVLHLADNALCRLPPSVANLTQLVELDLMGVKWIESQDSKTSLTLAAFTTFLNGNPLLERIDKKVCDISSLLRCPYSALKLLLFTFARLRCTK